MDNDLLVKPTFQGSSKKLSFQDDDEEEEGARIGLKKMKKENSSPVDEIQIELSDIQKKPHEEEKANCDQVVHHLVESKEIVISDKDLKKQIKNDSSKGEEKQTEEVDLKNQKLREIRAQIQSIRQQMEKEQTDSKSVSQRRKRESSPRDEQSVLDESCEFRVKIVSKRSKQREREKETAQLLAKFKKKLKEVSKKLEYKDAKETFEYEYSDDEWADLDKVDGDRWLMHRFEPKDDSYE